MQSRTNSDLRGAAGDHAPPQPTITEQEGAASAPNLWMQPRVVCREQPVHHGGLVLFDATNPRQRLAQVAVEACGNMLQTQCVEFQTVEQDDADACERVVIELADRLTYHVTP